MSESYLERRERFKEALETATSVTAEAISLDDFTKATGQPQPSSNPCRITIPGGHSFEVRSWAKARDDHLCGKFTNKKQVLPAQGTTEFLAKSTGAKPSRSARRPALSTPSADSQIRPRSFFATDHTVKVQRVDDVDIWRARSGKATLRGTGRCYRISTLRDDSGKVTFDDTREEYVPSWIDVLTYLAPTHIHLATPSQVEQEKLHTLLADPRPPHKTRRSTKAHIEVSRSSDDELEEGVSGKEPTESQP